MRNTTIAKDVTTFFKNIDRAVKKQTPEGYRILEITNPKTSWGPTPEMCDEIVIFCEHSEGRSNSLSMIWQLLTGTNAKNWKQTYKCLLLVEHLVLNACPSCVRDIQGHLDILTSLEDFSYRDEDGTDKGVNVRKRAELVKQLATAEDIDTQRHNAYENRMRYTEVAQSNVSGLGSGFVPQPKATIMYYDESVLYTKRNTAATFGSHASSSSSKPTQPASQQRFGIASSASATTNAQPTFDQHAHKSGSGLRPTGLQSMGLSSGSQQPQFGMGQPAQTFSMIPHKPAAQAPMPSPPAQPRAAPMAPAPAPAQAPAAAPAVAPVALPQMQLLPVLTPQQMQQMTPEQLQQYQQLMMQQQQMMQLMQQQLAASVAATTQPAPVPAAAPAPAPAPAAAPVVAQAPAPASKPKSALDDLLSF